jgi:hypothetical protein
MASVKQLSANRRSARRSTGPRTSAGKSRASKNAIKHGLTAEQVVLPWESAAELETLLEELGEDYSPVGVVERHLVLEIAMSMWQIARLHRIEAAVIEQQHYEAGFEENQEAMEELWKREVGIPEPLQDSLGWKRMHNALQRDGWPLFQALRSDGPLLGSAFKRAEPTLRLLPRYKASIEKSLYKALRGLENCQSKRMSAVQAVR